jgi:hypothetical protein
MVEFDNYIYLPYATTYAFYCSGGEPSFIEPESNNGSELTESPSTDPHQIGSICFWRKEK